MARPPLLFAAYGILPTTGVIVRLKRTTSHRGALNYIHANKGVLGNKYKMTFFVGGLRDVETDHIVSMHRHLRKGSGV